MDYDPKDFPIGMFDGHLTPFGGRSNIAGSKNTRSVVFKKPLNLYKAPPSVRPEPNESSMQPFGS